MAASSMPASPTAAARGAAPFTAAALIRVSGRDGGAIFYPPTAELLKSMVNERRRTFFAARVACRAFFVF